MSIFIKGMEMPKVCAECFMDPPCMKAFDPFKVDIWKERHPDCPLVEVKEPHGRLIDADAVNKAMDERIKKLKDDRSIYEASCVSIALDMFAPTVIEAEGSE